MLLQSAAGRGAVCCPRPVVGVRPVKWLRSGPIVYANGNKQQRANIKQQLKVTSAPKLDEIAPVQAPQPQQPRAPGVVPVLQPQQQQQQPSIGRLVWRRLVRELSSLPRAISLMGIITALSALGTIIPQNKPLDYYLVNYPSGAGAVLGFLDYDLLLTLQLDHIYSAWYFYSAIALLAASLAACTHTTQWPAAKVAQNWRFADSPAALARRAGPGARQTQVLPAAALRDVGAALAGAQYRVFISGQRLYGFKGLAGRLGPIGVHMALLACIAGTAYSGFGGWKGSVMIPEGQSFVVGTALRPASAIATRPGASGNVLQVNDFVIDTRPDGSVAQFYSDLTLRDPTGQQLLRKRISVNDPFRYGGVTMYQTDWSLAALTLRLGNTGGSSSSDSSSSSGAASAAAAQLLERLQADSSSSGSGASRAAAAAAAEQGGEQQRSFRLPLASLEGRPGVGEGAKLFATFLPLEPPPQDGRPPRGISMLARDLDTVTFYDSRGQFVGVRRAGSGKPIEVEGVSLTLDDIVGATGLELKSDPGVPLVYAGFGALMVTTLVSYISHSQVWAVQQGANVYVTGRSNRSKVVFERELDVALDSVPERPELLAAAALPAAAVGAAAGAAASTVNTVDSGGLQRAGLAGPVGPGQRS